jgi:polyhydroxyalkanoate synthase subunit PhaC
MTPDTHHHPNGNGTPKVDETPTERLDRLLHAAGAPLSGGLSPVSLSLALADWVWHLGVSPGRQMELAALASRLFNDTLRMEDGASEGAGAADDDPRFRHEAWTAWPYSQMRAGFRNAEAFWREAARVPGMTAHHADLTQFMARQWLGMMAPANWLATNPVVLRDAVDSHGAHLLKGAQNWLADATGVPTLEDAERTDPFVVGRDVAVTPGKVVYRNRLIELIRYAPQTDKVHPEPVLIIPSWIMKFYILDLSAHNSMVRYLVGQGHTVYMLSWRNPDASDYNLAMDDYLHLGVLDALQAIGRLGGRKVPVQAMGYCLGGTLLAIAAAALARTGGVRGERELPPIKTLTLLAAQTDFSEPGELGLFIDESQIGLLDNITRGQGYLSGKQMAGSFQFLHSRDLVWTRRMREYLMGEREQSNDLMAWNADTTRMPARMHHEYLTSLYLNNALATSSYRVEGRTVSVGDIRQPVFMVGTQRDHISPWRSVYKLHHLCDAEITFVLTSGGHNAGIISEPGHAGRSYQMDTRPAHGPWVEPDQWAAQAPVHEGSWWPAWQAWLARQSSRKVAARPIDEAAALGDAPGDYVLQRYRE